MFWWLKFSAVFKGKNITYTIILKVISKFLSCQKLLERVKKLNLLLRGIIIIKVLQKLKSKKLLL